MGDRHSDEDENALNRAGEEPAVESGAGYGDHAPEAEAEEEDRAKHEG